ncbi:diacylglycerol/lipid kinase family protein [Kineococcus sp. R86509]|uniref:diacylglycerol/lipid kinase family protein n=1 Tax=Kineococcus sp. R86509 TaxID=3093851 RepID=UPI0036D3EBAD
MAEQDTTRANITRANITQVLGLDGRRQRAAVVLNPTKFTGVHDLAVLHREVSAALARCGWTLALWLPTTAETLGRAETRCAVAAGVDVVLAAGGDGTVRAVAGELLGSGVALGIVPVGTGNLLARNLGIPLDDVSAAVQVACEGPRARLDVGRLEVDRDGDGRHVREHVFLVMAGAGFDAAMMAGAGTQLKRRWGHAAYVISGVRALRRAPSVVSVQAVDANGWTEGRTRSAHGVVVGNCGQLTMGLSLLPGADPTDGFLDAVVLLPDTLLQWARAAGSLVWGRGRPQPLLPRLRSRSIEVSSDVALPVQVDGDVVGSARRLRLSTAAAALSVCRPDAAGARAHDGIELSLAS